MQSIAHKVELLSFVEHISSPQTAIADVRVLVRAIDIKSKPSLMSEEIMKFRLYAIQKAPTFTGTPVTKTFPIGIILYLLFVPITGSAPCVCPHKEEIVP